MSKLIEEIDAILDSIGKEKLSSLMLRALKVAKRLKDSNLEKWLLLESNGYFNNNTAFSNKVKVPDYRMIAVIYKDVHNRVLQIADSELSNILTAFPMRYGISELEILITKNESLVFYDQERLSWLNDEFNLALAKIISHSSALMSVISNVSHELMDFMIKHQQALVEATPMETVKKGSNDEKKQGWKRLIMTAQLDKVIDDISDFSNKENNKALSRKIILVASSYRDLKSRKAMIRHDDYSIAMTRIRESLLDIIDEI